MSENHFEPGERKTTETDVALAKAYYPMLVKLSDTGTIITFKELVDNAKQLYPDNYAVQKAIPVSTGRRLEFIRKYTKRHELPDLSAWIVNQSGKNADAFTADFDPEEERKNSLICDYSKFTGEWGDYIDDLLKQAITLTKRKMPEAESIMAEYGKLLRDKIEAAMPNPKKLRYAKLVAPFRGPIIEGLMEGKDVEDVFSDVIFDMTKSRSAEEIQSG
tara:strand:+ start:2068 stop:2721 length:654 start_codon:yes stop_codon:yes gene_type:complete